METKETERPRFSLDTISGPDAARQFSALLDRSFGVPFGRHFLEDFPVWDESIVPSGPGMIRLGAFLEGGALVASAAARIAYLKAPYGEIPVAIIGAVATDTGSRGHGLATRLVSFATEWAKSKSAAVTFLWGSEHALYQRLGFELCGAQARVALKDLDLPLNRSQTLGTDWTPALFGMLRNRPAGLALRPEDIRWIQAHRYVRWFWIGPSSAPLAYAAMGRGIDMPGIIHEWGGDRQALKTLLGTIKELYPDSSLLGPEDLLTAFGLISEKFEQECLCLAKILDPVPVFRAHHPDLAISSRNEGEQFRVSIGGSPDTVISERELSRLFFGPSAARASYFPLRFWIWGLDAA